MAGLVSCELATVLQEPHQPVVHCRMSAGTLQVLHAHHPVGSACQVAEQSLHAPRRHTWAHTAQLAGTSQQYNIPGPEHCTQSKTTVGLQPLWPPLHRLPRHRPPLSQPAPQTCPYFLLLHLLSLRSIPGLLKLVRCSSGSCAYLISTFAGPCQQCVACAAWQYWPGPWPKPQIRLPGHCTAVLTGSLTRTPFPAFVVQQQQRSTPDHLVSLSVPHPGLPTQLRGLGPCHSTRSSNRTWVLKHYWGRTGTHQAQPSAAGAPGQPRSCSSSCCRACRGAPDPGAPADHRGRLRR